MPRNTKRDDAVHACGIRFGHMLHARRVIKGNEDQQEWLAHHIGKLVERVTYLERQVNGMKSRRKSGKAGDGSK